MRRRFAAVFPSYWLIALADPRERPSLFLDQTEARRDENKFFRDRPPLSQGLYPALNCSLFVFYKYLKVSKFWKKILHIICMMIRTYFVVDLSL